MKATSMYPIALCAVIGILNACTTLDHSSPTASLTAPLVVQRTSQMRASDRMFYWIEEARELHAMATHRAREAELVLKKYPGPSTNEFVQHMRLFAHQLQEAADYADGQAKEAEQEVPPEIIQQLPSAVRVTR